jgi:cytochrome c-type biogenesis protein CcmH/NrfG
VWPDPALYAARLEPNRSGCSPGVTRRSAIRDARTAVARDPSAPTAWSTLGALELDAGDLDAARVAYRRALRWNPQSTLALSGLASIARDEGRSDDTARLCRRFHALLPDGVCTPRRD